MEARKTTLLLTETVQRLGGRGPFHAPHSPTLQAIVPSPPQPKLLPRSFSWTRAWSFPPALRAPGTKLLASDSSAAPVVVSGHRRCACAPVPHPARTRASSVLPALLLLGLGLLTGSPT